MALFWSYLFGTFLLKDRPRSGRVAQTHLTPLEGVGGLMLSGAGDVVACHQQPARAASQQCFHGRA